MSPLVRTIRKLRPLDAAGLLLCALAAVPLALAKVNPLLRPRAAAADSLARPGASAGPTEAAVRACRQQLADLQQELRRLGRPLEPAGQINRRLARLTELAEKSGLVVNEIVPGRPRGGKEFDVVPLRIIGTGRYPSCAEFLSALRAAFPDVSLAGMELAAERSEQAGRASFRLCLLWYARK